MPAARRDTVVRQAGAPQHALPAKLVEEASIGVVDGDEEYMLGEVADIALGADGSIFVFDRKVPVVRQYDAGGRFVRNVGRRGSGPGEYRSTSGLATTRDGRLLLWDTGNWRINVYSPSGQVLPQWSTPSGSGSSIATYSRAMLVDTAGIVYCRTYMRSRESPLMRTPAWIRVAANGVIRDTVSGPAMPFPEPQVSATGSGGHSMSSAAVPFAPRPITVVSPLGYFVTGYPDRYAFEIHAPGQPILSVRRSVAAQPVSSGERAAERRRVEESMRQTDPGWSWNGPDIPKTTPFYTDLVIGLDGRIWVAVIAESSQRVGSVSGPASIGSGPPGRAPVRPAPTGEKDKRDQRPALYDVFEPTGAFVGQVEVPARVSTVLRRGDQVWAVAYDDEDVARVKRYRIVWR